MIDISLHPNVKDALMHPQKGMEVRGWLKSHKDVARVWRGENGESMMHWAFLSDSVLASDLLGCGLSFEEKDNTGRQPFDWLTDRLFGAVLGKSSHILSKGGQERLIKQSEELMFRLWGLGARPKNIPETGKVWLSAGAFEAIPLFSDEFGVLNWLPSGGSLLHALVLAPNTPKRVSLAKDTLLSMDINSPDHDGRAPLWYAADTWLKHEAKRSSMNSLAQTFMALGADPDIKDKNGLSPKDVVVFDQKHEDILKIMTK